MGLSVYIGIWPFLVYYFHRLSFAGLLANWTVFPLSGVLMILGLAVGTWGADAPGSVPHFLVSLIHGAVRMTLALIMRMSAWPWAVLAVAPPPWWASVLYYGFLFGILFVIRRRKTYGQIHSSLETGRARLQRR
jgi:competence protein ComEC